MVSRVILSREKGSVTIFAFDEGQGLSEHTSPFDALVQAVEGEAEVTVAGKPIALKTGEVVLLPAEKPHAVKATSRFKMVLTMIRAKNKPTLGIPRPITLCCVCDKSSRLTVTVVSASGSEPTPELVYHG